MGLFGGIGKALKHIDWGKVQAGMQSAGAISHGDYGTAAQIQQLYRRGLDDRHEQEAKQQQYEAAVAALVARGVPEREARVIAAGGSADTVLAQRNQPLTDDAFERAMRGANIDPASPQGQELYRQRAATMASPAPQMVPGADGSYRFVTPPAPQMPQGQPQQAGGPQPGAVVNGFRFKGGNPNDRASWEPVSGGAGSNVGGGFRNYPRY